MTPRSGFSAQTLSVLAALSEQPSQWQHGYALATETHLKSGTLYPILIRLAERGLVAAQWQDQPEPGRPRRHLYRLTAAGLAAATAARARAVISMTATDESARSPRRPQRPQPGRAVTTLSGTARTATASVAPDPATVS